MSLTVLERPSKSISGETYKWNAVGNPIVYKMQTIDVTFDSVDTLVVGDPIKLKISGANVAAAVTAAMTAGTPIMSNGYQVMWVNFTDPSYLSGPYEFLGATYGAPNTYIDLEYIGTTDVLSTGINSGGTILGSGLLNRGVEFTVHDKLGAQLGLSTFTSFMSPNGFTYLDVSKILRTYLTPNNDFDLTQVFPAKVEDVNVNKEFFIKYREVYTGSANSFTDDTANRFYAMFAALQIPAAQGGNLYQYTTVNDGVPKALFLTKLDRIVYWQEYPFTIEYLVGSNVTGNIKFNASDGFNFIGTVNSVQTSKVMQVPFKGIISGVLLDSLDQGVKVWDIFLTNETAALVLIDHKVVELRKACINPIMLLGRNSLGGPLWWLFDINQEDTRQIDNERKVRRLRLMAENLSLNEFEALQDFVTLGAVSNDNIQYFDSTVIKTQSRDDQQVYVVDTAGNKIGVTVLALSTRTLTKQVRHRLELVIEYPETFMP